MSASEVLFRPDGAAERLPQQPRRPAHRSRRLSRVAFAEGLTAIILSALLLLAVAGLTAAVAQAGYRLDHARAGLAAAQDVNRRLQVDVAELQSPSRIAALAKSKLGMHAPSSFDTVVPQPVTSLPVPVPHSAVIAIAPVRPGPGSVAAVWASLRTWVAARR